MISYIIITSFFDYSHLHQNGWNNYTKPPICLILCHIHFNFSIMALTDDIIKLAQSLSLEAKTKGDLITLSATLAERKAFLSKKKLEYSARIRINEAKKEVNFSEMLKESGFGLSSGSNDMSPGFGFKTESYNTFSGAREGGIKEQSDLFGKKYTYTFDYAKIRKEVEALAEKSHFAFKYHILPV